MHNTKIFTKPILLNCSKWFECMMVCFNFLLMTKLIVLWVFYFKFVCLLGLRQKKKSVTNTVNKILEMKEKKTA